MDDPWGIADPPALVATEPLPPRLAALAAVTGQTPWSDREFAAPEELPEVAALMREGWYPLDDAPYTVALPAVWPREHRCWVADRLPRVSFDDDGGWARPWSEEDRAWVEDDLESVTRACGLPPRPPGRLWLLRSPWPGLPMDAVLDAIGERMRERGLVEMAEGLTEAAREVLGWPEVLVRTYLP